MNNKNSYESLKPLVLLTQLGINMTLYPIICMFLGKYIDKWLGTGQVFTLILVILGFIAGFRMAFRSLKGVIK